MTKVMKKCRDCEHCIDYGDHLGCTFPAICHWGDDKIGFKPKLENEAGDIARYNSLKQYEFATPGRDFEGQIAKRYLKGYIEAIEKYGSKE